jgi:hypothetical protein
MYAPELLMGFQTSDEVIEIQAAPEGAPTPPAVEPEQQPVVQRRSKGVSGARREAEKTVDATEPAKTVEPAKPADPAPAAPAPAAEVPPTETAIPAAKTLRCEITNVTEKQARKAGGVVGPVCTVTLTGELMGDALFDGAMEQVPANGAIIDAVIEERALPSGAKVKILVSFTQAS